MSWVGDQIVPDRQNYEKHQTLCSEVHELQIVCLTSLGKGNDCQCFHNLHVCGVCQSLIVIVPASTPELKGTTNGRLTQAQTQLLSNINHHKLCEPGSNQNVLKQWPVFPKTGRSV